VLFRSPFALTIGATQTLQSMNNDSELTVIDASGAPRRTIYRPMLVLAGVICALSFAIDNFLEPVTRLGMRQTIAAAYADLLSSVIEEKTFRKIDDNLYVQISKRLQGRILQGLFVADNRDPRFELIYYAREGAVDEKGGTLIMKNGEIQRKTPEGSPSVIHFDSYTFDLSELSESKGHAQLRASDRDLLFLFAPDQNDDDAKERPRQYQAELHRRLTDWFYPVTFVMISLIFGGSAHSNREARVHPLVPAFAFAFLFRLVTFYLGNRIESGSGSPLALYVFIAAVNLALFAAAYYITTHLRESRLAPAVIDRLGALWNRLRASRLGTGGPAR
jgi:lipopolysaccharide export system permease protein